HTAVRGGASADKEHLTLVGRVFVEPVDARRILVAVTTRTDGASEHLFLYTASRRLTASPRARSLQATVYYESTGGLRITPALGGGRALEHDLPGIDDLVLEQQQARGAVVVGVDLAEVFRAVIAGGLAAVHGEDRLADDRERALERAEGGVLEGPLHAGTFG